MRVLIIGNGGREHALAWKIRQSPEVEEIYLAPGNPGMVGLGDAVPIGSADTVELADFAEKLRIDLTVVGPELPLSLGIVDEFEKRGLRIFGPRKSAAELEGSKAFSKDFMKKYGIPTADSRTVTDLQAGLAAVDEIGLPIVIKADGLAGGKGVIVANERDDAEKALRLMFEQKVFGSAGERVVVEQFLEGEELSFIVITDGQTVIPLAAAKDYKKIFEDDRGPNTGGMGAHSPAVVISGEVQGQALKDVIYPAIRGMESEGRPFKGCLYAGLMLTAAGPKVLEFNCRFGDPETQAVMMRMESDLVPILIGAADGALGDAKIAWKKEASVALVLVSRGYPGPFETGKPIEGLDTALDGEEGMVIFHAGTTRQEGRLVTSGGRVLNIGARAATLKEALEKAYRVAERVEYDGKFYRRDIGYLALSRKKV